jgi:hypothetical protein
MGSRFVIAMFAAFLATLVMLTGAGYVVTRIGVGPPRDPFRAGSFEFDLAPGWWCEREDSAYVCSPSGPPPYDATVIIAIKERGDQDAFDAYERHLRQAQKPAVDPDGAGEISEVRYVKRITLGHAEWLESLKIGSEISNYDTYYLATVTSLLGILVTMSVHRDREAFYVQQLKDMMGTLNVYQSTPATLKSKTPSGVGD